MDEGQDRVKASYRGNYDRLAQIKRRHDPDNMFHINQNIQPASGAHPVGRTGRARPTLRGRAHLAVELPM
jgi:hypothetical protein